MKGDLQDMSLANLVQMLCLDQRKAVLNLKRSRARNGVLIFDSGQVIHAEAGLLVGEEAVYDLLSWGDGTFEMNELLTTPHQTVTVSWSHLLMESMRQIDEQRLIKAEQHQLGSELSVVEIAQDDGLEDQLTLLLSELEQLQIRLGDKKHQKQPIMAIQPLTEIINQVIVFFETLPNSDATGKALIEILANIADTYPTARLLRVQRNRLSTRIISRLYDDWADSIAERKQTFSEIIQCMLAIVEMYVLDITTYFLSPVIIGQWRETCEIFLAELRQEAEKLQF